MRAATKEPGGTYERLLQAAEDEFAACGFKGASILNIATAAGISKASLFHYFASKEQVYRAVIGQIFERLAKVITQQPVEPLPDQLQQLRYGVAQLHDFIASNPNYSRILFHRILEDSDRVREGSKTLIKPIVDQSADFIRRGSEAGVFRGVDPAQTVLSILSIIVFFYAAAPLVEACTGSEVFSPDSIAARRSQILDQVTAMVAAAPRGFEAGSEATR